MCEKANQDTEEDQGTAQKAGETRQEAAVQPGADGARMNMTQYREIRETIAKVDALERRLVEQESKYSAMCEVFDILVNRGKGRPSRADIDRLEAAQARMHGANH